MFNNQTTIWHNTTPQKNFFTEERFVNEGGWNTVKNFFTKERSIDGRGWNKVKSGLDITSRTGVSIGRLLGWGVEKANSFFHIPSKFVGRQAEKGAYKVSEMAEVETRAAGKVVGATTDIVKDTALEVPRGPLGIIYYSTIKQWGTVLDKSRNVIRSVFDAGKHLDPRQLDPRKYGGYIKKAGQTFNEGGAKSWKHFTSPINAFNSLKSGNIWGATKDVLNFAKFPLPLINSLGKVTGVNTAGKALGNIIYNAASVPGGMLNNVYLGGRMAAESLWNLFTFKHFRSNFHKILDARTAAKAEVAEESRSHIRPTLEAGGTKIREVLGGARQRVKDFFRKHSLAGRRPSAPTTTPPATPPTTEGAPAGGG